MLQRDLNYAMVKTAVNKGIRDILDHPQRGIRNLVDLGEMFATGPFQQDFFALARKALTDPENRYYQLVEGIVHRSDPEVLTQFGMNLGYQCWTVNAKEIRRIESKQGFNVPWCILFELSPGHILAEGLLKETIRQGKALGIGSYFFLLRDSASLPAVLQLIRTEPDCAFVLFTDPKAVSAQTADQLLAAANAWLLLDLTQGKGAAAGESIGEKPTGAAHGSAAEAAAVSAEIAAIQILRDKRCLFGGYAPYTRLTDDAKSLMARCEALGVSVLVLVGQKHRPVISSEEAAAFRQLRTRLPVPVLPLDLYGDIAQVDRNISSEACFTLIQGDGTVITTNADALDTRTQYRITERPLQEIFRRTMKKHQQ